MKKKILNFLESQFPVAVAFLLFGIFLVAMPVNILNILCKVVFGLALILAGIFNIFTYVKTGSNRQIAHLYAGVMSIVVGIFLFTNPQIVVKLLPWIFGSFVMVDCIWLIKQILFIRNNHGNGWEAYTVVVLVFFVLAVLMIVNPFGEIRKELVFCGWIMGLKGLSDILLTIILGKKVKQMTSVPQPGYDVVPVEKTAKEKKKFQLPHFTKNTKKEKGHIVDDAFKDTGDDIVDAQIVGEEAAYADNASVTPDSNAQPAEETFGTDPAVDAWVDPAAAANDAVQEAPVENQDWVDEEV